MQILVEASARKTHFQCGQAQLCRKNLMHFQLPGDLGERSDTALKRRWHFVHLKLNKEKVI